MDDFKFNPGLPDEVGNESSFFTSVTQNSKTAPLPEKKQAGSFIKAKAGKATGANDIVLNHRILMCTVVFGYEEDGLKILLLDADSNNSNLALPGCLATANQTLEDLAREMVYELTGAENFFIEQVYSFGNPARELGVEKGNPASTGAWEITVAFFALVKIPDGFNNRPLHVAKWYTLDKSPPLSAEQNKIVDKALSTLRFEIRHFPIAFELLPEKFTLAQVQSLYQAISGKKLDKRNFRKKLKALNLVRPAGEKVKNVIARPSELFVFNRDIYSDSHNSIL